jgi:hypothetical protein
LRYYLRLELRAGVPLAAVRREGVASNGHSYSDYSAREAFGGDGWAQQVAKQSLASLAIKSPEVHEDDDDLNEAFASKVADTLIRFEEILSPDFNPTEKGGSSDHLHRPPPWRRLREPDQVLGRLVPGR